jgi:hypothetical protein
MAAKKHYKYMTEHEFDLIKALTKTDMSYGELKRLTGRGSGTIQNIRKSDSFEEYHARVKAFADKYHSKKSVINVTTSPLLSEPQPITDNQLLMEEMKKNNELVIKLTASLDDLVRTLQSLSQPKTVVKEPEPAKKWPW